MRLRSLTGNYHGVCGLYSSGGMDTPLIMDEICFVISFVHCLWIVPLNLIKLARFPQVDDQDLPSLYILIAPESVVLCGWLAQHPENTGFLTHFLFVIALVILLFIGGRYTHRLVRTPFNFSFASLTFPMDTASTGMWKYYQATGRTWVLGLACVQLSVCTLVVGYVSARYAYAVVQRGLHLLSADPLQSQCIIQTDPARNQVEHSDPLSSEAISAFLSVSVSTDSLLTLDHRDQSSSAHCSALHLPKVASNQS